jgi:GNAT superfamily N-acetyltransferase
LSEAVWKVRRAGEADAARLALVGAATFLETFADVLDGAAIVAHCEAAHAAAQYRAYLDAGAAAWLGETANASPVAYALLAAPGLPGAREDGSDVELKRIYLLSRFQGTGLGGALMQAAVDEAARRGAARLLLASMRTIIVRWDSIARTASRRSASASSGWAGAITTT